MRKAEEQTWPSAGRAWYVIAVLFIAYAIAFLDRQILVLLIDPIKSALSLSDTQLSLLHGFAFALFYTLLGLPIGRLVDSGNRRNIIIVGMIVWSFMTAACGLATGFWSLLVCRFAVGAGEAALSPAAYSMIADYFPPGRRARALAVYSFGIPAGIGLAFMFGGLIVGWAQSSGGASLPFVGELDVWQLAFIAVGLPGVAVALLVLTVREPRRSESGRQLEARLQSSVPLPQVLLHLKTHRRAYFFLFTGLAILTMVSYGILTWAPALFYRRFGWTPGQLGFWYGLINIVGGCTGIFGAGWLSDTYGKAGRADGPMRATAWAATGCLLLAPIATLMPGPVSVMLMLLLALTFVLAPFGIAAEAIQAITPNRMRGQFTALYLLVINLVGLGLGPTFVALITDYVLRDERQVHLSISLAALLLTPIAVALLWLGLPAYRKARAAMANGD